MMKAIALALLLATSGTALAKTEVSAARVRAHLDFLAGPELRGRGSATPDEGVAAAYVASQFESYGLVKAPGMASYLQKAPVLRQVLAAPAELLVGGVAVPGVRLIRGQGGVTGGTVAVFGQAAAGTKAGVLVVPDQAVAQGDVFKAAAAMGASVIVVPEGAQMRRATEAAGGRPRLPVRLAETAASSISLMPRGFSGALLSASPEAVATLSRAGTAATLVIPFTAEHTVTTNAIAYLPGSDPTAGLILLTAHLDHLGVAPDGTVWPGANDDASGTVALLELARAMAAGKRPRRGVLFVAYGSEEAGGLGSTWFGEHPPVPLDHITANLEFEMLGAPEPKLPGKLMMTGYERSNLGPTLVAHGALVGADPYPEEHYFQRSDNYSLALKGVVAHTLSGYGAPATYHTPEDTPDRVDVPYMVKAIGSLFAPVRYLTESRFEPKWNPGGRPAE